MKNIICFFCFLSVIGLPSCNNSPTKKYVDITEQDYKHDSDTIDVQRIYFKTATAANTAQEVINLNAGQVAFIRESLIHADSLIKVIFPDKSVTNFTIENLDDLIDAWNTDSSKFKCSRTYFINSIGVAFGEYLVKEYKMRWEIVADENGSDYSTTIDELRISNFPINSVLKAIDQKREGSLSTISLVTKREISELGKKK